MRVVTYRELQSKNELLPLFQHAFWWPFNPKQFEKTIRADPRLQDTPVGYAAMEKNRLVGFVGVMSIATRTIQGSEEKAGGIWGVVTHPAHSRRGISTALMNRSHEHFRKEGCKFSLLNTSKSLIAYRFYLKLGYKDLIIYPSAYKVTAKKERAPKKISKTIKLDWNKILEVYRETTRDRSGFVVRDRHFGAMLETRMRIHPEKSIVTDKSYVLLKESEGNIHVQELGALTKEEISRLITQIEDRATNTIIDPAVLNNTLQKTYLSHGFMMLEDSYEVLMYKPLTNEVFAEVYGDKFYTTASDYF